MINLYMQPLTDAMADVGLSEYRHLSFDPGHPGLTIEFEQEPQINYFAESLGLPHPELSGHRARWANVLILPGEAADG